MHCNTPTIIILQLSSTLQLTEQFSNHIYSLTLEGTQSMLVVNGIVWIGCCDGTLALFDIRVCFSI
jgi:hypothetical protein